MAGLLRPPAPGRLTVAGLRYRLFDVDRIISRTLAHALLTLLLGGGYAAVVLGLGEFLGQDSSLVVAAATLAFSTRLRQEIDLDTLSVELPGVAEQTMQPTSASLWLRPR